MTRHNGCITVPAWAIAIGAVALTLGPRALATDNKSGVSPTTVSRPTGPGSLEGLGDAFQPALNTGMARYTVRLTLPEGVAGFSPELSLRYDSGRGFGPAGIGWSFGPGGIRRQAEKGLPRYADAPVNQPDRFLGMNDEELIPLSNGYYLAKTESAFLRYRQVGNHWEAHSKDGTKLEFGLTPEARVSDSTDMKVYRWCLQRQTDVNGNVIEYDYVRPSEEDRQVYLSGIRYGPGGGPWTHYYAVSVVYEDRPDPRTDYRSGFKIRTTKRISRVDVKYTDALIRRYALGYTAHEHWSLLTTITQYGDDGVSTLPVTTFAYATFPSDPEDPLSAYGRVIESTNEPGTVMDNPEVDLIDINSDGLPDLLGTDAGHWAYLNRGATEIGGGGQAIVWEGPISLDVEDSSVLQYGLSEPGVHLADMTGDAIADFVVTEMDEFGYTHSVEYFPNTGQGGWGAGRLMSIELSPPPAPFGPNGTSVLTSDLDFDKRTDVIKSEAGAYSIWFNLGGGRYSDEVLVDCARHGGQCIDFADAGVQLADMNGDRLNDVAKITTDSVVYCASMGYGQFDDDDCTEIWLPDRRLDDSPGGNLHRARLTDVNGDGLCDLAVERAQGDDLWFWLNMGNDTFAHSQVIIDLPATAPAEARWVDINGNGTTDLVYADSVSMLDSRINAVDLGELIAGTAYLNALTGIDNGYGRKITVSYRSSTDFYVDAYEMGNPWVTSVPFPVAVVSQTQTSIGLDLDGIPDEGLDGDVYITDYVYRDGYYDSLEKQFRGFAFVKQIRRGDDQFDSSSAPTLVTRYGFHTGAPDGLDNDGDGSTDEYDEWNGREEEQFKGVELWQETCSLPDEPMRDGRFADDAVVFERIQTTWEVRELCAAASGTLPDVLNEGYQTADPFGRTVRHAFVTRVERSVIERQSNQADHRHLETLTDVDPLGNTTFEQNLGDLADSSDDLYAGYEYAINEEAWILNRVSRTFQRTGTVDGAFVSEARNYYDGPPFQGLPLGQIGGRGGLHRMELFISGGSVPALTERSFLRGDPRDPDGRVDALRQRLDEFGNAVVVLNANAALGIDGMPDGVGHERDIEYDALLHKFPVRETIVVGGGSLDLSATADYDYGFGTPATVTDFNGNETNYTFDTFGRLENEILPGDDPATPTRTYDYDLGVPVSSITTTAHAREGDSPDVIKRHYFDGLGRALGTYEVGGPVMKGVTLYNPRGLPSKVLQPYFGEPFDGEGDWLLPEEGTVPATISAYDATGRPVETVTPEDDNGEVARITRTYLPLTVVQADGEDNNIGGSHAGTPKTLGSDGLGRLIEVREIEMLSDTDSGQSTTLYRYALPGLLAEIEDSYGNIKYMRYDGLGRRIFMNDCDRGHTTHSYDAAGNTLSTVDAKGQTNVYTYDGANRLLTEDYLDSGNAVSLERSPDVIYHYDRPSPAYPMLRNVGGQLAWVEDLTGAELHGFDARGNLETVVKRVDQIDGTTRDWTTVTLSDHLARVYQTIYPDGSVVRQRYDARGLLHAVPGFVEELTYEASGKRATSSLGNGVTTTYIYDPRLRLASLTAESASGLLQHLSYDYDQADNVLGITDDRALSSGSPRNQTAGFQMDDSYRLTGVTGAGYGTIEYDYDRLGNMVSKTSPDIADPEVDLGRMISGGTGGVSGRIGREPGGSPGPHALTSVVDPDDGSPLQGYSYDANGNLTSDDDCQYLYDFKSRLAKVVKGGQDIRYLHDYADRRVIKRVDGTQTTYINRLSEIRDEKLIKYLYAGPGRAVRIDGIIPPPPLVAQRISLTRGWNLFSFQVVPPSADPAETLGGIAGKYTVVFGHDGSDYTRFQLGAVDNTLTELSANHGYWIYVTESTELLLEGPVSDTPVELSVDGYELIGLPGLAQRDIDILGSQYPSIEAIWVYLGDDIGWRSFDTASPDYVNSLTNTAPGLGYWFATDQATVLTQPPPVPAELVYFHADHLGSINVTTDANGEVVSETLYYPFGATRLEHTVGPEGFNPHYRFTGKERDSETGLQYFQARHYADHLGRFIAVDPLVAGDPAGNLGSPRVLNVYAYAFNNPLRHIDPTGLLPFDVSDVDRVGHGLLGDEKESGGPSVFDSIREVLGTVSEVIETVQAVATMLQGIAGDSGLDFMKSTGAGKVLSDVSEGIETGVDVAKEAVRTAETALDVADLALDVGEMFATGDPGDIAKRTADVLVSEIARTGPTGGTIAKVYRAANYAIDKVTSGDDWWNDIQGHQVKDALGQMGVNEQWADLAGTGTDALQGDDPLGSLQE